MYSLVLMAALTTGGEVPHWGRRGCHGCWGCYVSCWYGCACWGCCGWWVPCGGCCGCYGARGYVYSSYAPAMTYSYVPAGTSYAAVPARSSETASSQRERATLVVHLPADAQLTVEDQPTKQKSAHRLFVSPPLDPGKTYYYTLRAEVVRNGEKLTATREVAVRAGQRTEVTLDLAAMTTAHR